MQRWLLVVVMSLSMFMVPHLAHVADESCSGVAHCSRQIAVTDANSRVQFGFTTSEVCVLHEGTSANTVFVQFSGDAAQADVDHSFPLTVARAQICLWDGRRTNQVNIIADTGLTATVDVIALKQ